MDDKASPVWRPRNYVFEAISGERVQHTVQLVREVQFSVSLSSVVVANRCKCLVRRQRAVIVITMANCISLRCFLHDDFVVSLAQQGFLWKEVTEVSCCIEVNCTIVPKYDM
jgi:hypothetical protein